MTRRFKINPDGSCPELAGYGLPPCSRCQEDDVEKLSDESNGYLVFSSKAQGTKAMAFDEGFKSGYRKAREKFEFTESQLRQAFEAGRNMATDILECRRENNLITFEKFIQSLRAPRTPIAIEVEMERLDGERIPCSELVITKWRPATNPDGTVKGTYIFNEP